jgi:hypothetical protein
MTQIITLTRKHHNKKTGIASTVLAHTKSIKNKVRDS